jgi:hypothetical protein
MWDAQDGVMYSVAKPSDVATIDIPGGWYGSRVYYQRTFPDQPGRIEIRSASWDGSDDRLIWEDGNTTAVSGRPVATGGGLLIATPSNWILVSPDGIASDMGPNTVGSVGAPILSPGGSLIAYDAGGQVFVASVQSPGAPLNAGIVYIGGFGAGFAFATSGEEVVVTSSSGMSLYSIYGDMLASAATSSQIAAPYWIEDSIYFLEIGSSTVLRALSASQLLAG